jgi:hypothetical protein
MDDDAQRHEEDKVHHLKKVLLVTALLLPATRVRADDRELYHAEVCNQGRVIVDVAVAYRDFGLNDEFWVIERWWHVRPGECKLVFRHFYAPNNVLNFRPFPLHLAFAFTDSTGTWGAAKINPPGNTARSHLQLCVARNDQKYREDDDDPATACKKSSEGFLIPASIDWEPTNGSTCCTWYNHDYGPPARFMVALDANDRAIPLGPRASSGGVRRGASIPPPFSEGTLTARFKGRKIVRWRNKPADEKWYYEDGSPVTQDREMRGLTGVENSPLFDDTLYNPRADRSKQTEIMKVIQHELEGERGGQTAVTTDEFGRFTYILRRRGIEALGLDTVYEDELQVAVHPYALDFEHAKIERGRNSAFSLVIPCRKNLTTRSGSTPSEGFEDACAVDRPIVKDTLGDDLPGPSIMFAVASEESGRIVISALRDLLPEMDKRFRRGSVESR